MLDESQSKRSEAQRDERGESRRVLKRPYVRPAFAHQDLQHAVKGTGTADPDPGGGRAPGLGG